MPTQFEVGFLVGLLVGEGHFGGDGRQPQVTLRMHVRHEAIFRWLERTFPGGRLYGPYHHGGRDYFQWMARGSFLQDELAPLLDQWLSPDLDRHSFDRFQLMKSHYPQLAAGIAARGQPAGQHADLRAAARRSVTRRPDTPAADDTANDPAAVRSASTTRAGDRDGPESRSASPVAPDPYPLADLFSQLREAWP